MVRLAHALVDTRQGAEEVVQDAFAAIYTRYSRLERPEAYLRVTVLNGCRRMLRRRMLSRRLHIGAPEESALAEATSSTPSAAYRTASAR
jgi:DNA-directed RNA polymerase specialized sigma24 family protein